MSSINLLPPPITSLPLPTGAATEATLAIIKTDIEKPLGTWKHYSGISGGILTLAGERVIGITAYSKAGGEIDLDGAVLAVIPPGVSVAIEPNGNLAGIHNFLFTTTDTFIVEVVY
jgi:hypothetical protein